jgi:hypothetical protein
MRWLPLIFVFALACTGPEADDVTVCKDYVHRICQPDLCDPVVPLVPAGADCQTALLAKSGCDKADFKFTDPSRDTFLNCRVALVRAGDNVEQHPSCDDVAESFDRCPNVRAMFNAADGGT